MERMPESSGGDDREQEQRREERQREREEVAIISLPVFDQRSMGSWGSADSWSTAPEERSFTFLLRSFPASAKSLLVFQTTAAVKTHHGFLHAREDLANALQGHCPAGPRSLVRFLSSQTLFCYFMLSIIFLFTLTIINFSCVTLPTERSEVMFSYRAALVWLRDPVFCSRVPQQDKCMLMKNQNRPERESIRRSQNPAARSAGSPSTGINNQSLSLSYRITCQYRDLNPKSLWSVVSVHRPAAGMVYGDGAVKVLQLLRVIYLWV